MALIAGRMSESGEIANYSFLGLFSEDISGLLLWSSVSIVFYFAVVLFFCRSVVNKIVAGRFSGRISRLINFWRFTALGISVVISFVLGWGAITSYLPRFSIITDLIWMFPFLALVLIQLVCCYPLDLAGRGGLDGDSVNSVWSFRQYIIYNIRHHIMGVLVFILSISLFDDILSGVLRLLGPLMSMQMRTDIIDSEVLSLVAIALVYIVGPVLLKTVWATSPLPAGEQKDSLDNFCKGIGLKYNSILKWHTYDMIGNAAVTGLIPKLRYIIVSDKLLTGMTSNQLCAVFGHEAGHIRYKHMPLMIMAITGMAVNLSLLSDELLYFIPDTTADWIYSTVEIALLVLLMAAGFLLFGFVSRNFEQEADVCGAMAVAGEGSGNDKLSTIGSAIMSSALQRLSFLNGISVSAKSWRHSSLSNRMAVLYQLAVEPGALALFERKLKLIKLAVIINFILAVLLYIVATVNSSAGCGLEIM